MADQYEAKNNTISKSEELVFHYTSRESAELIIAKGSNGLRASQVRTPFPLSRELTSGQGLRLRGVAGGPAGRRAQRVHQNATRPWLGAVGRRPVAGEGRPRALGREVVRPHPCLSLQSCARPTRLLSGNGCVTQGGHC